MYQTVLFDVDGVMLSEERYFDASALTVYELLYSPQYLGLDASADGLPPFTVALAESDVRAIRRSVFADDHVLHAIKSRGVNANWDMVYLQTALQLSYAVQAYVHRVGVEPATTLLVKLAKDGWDRAALRTLGASLSSAGVRPSVAFARFVDEVTSCTDKAALFAQVEQPMATAVNAAADRSHNASIPAITPFSHQRALWNVCQMTFQEWYVGDAHVQQTRQPGKRGFLTDEIPLVPRAEFSQMLHHLQAYGVQLGIATGRPQLETMVPLDALGWLDEFEHQRISTASDVLAAERATPEAAPLSKPHPFSYVRSYLRTDDACQVLQCALPFPADEGKCVLVVGDSIADLLAARAAGFDFAAVLTGLEGEAARPAFEARGADYIFKDVLAVSSLF